MHSIDPDYFLVNYEKLLPLTADTDAHIEAIERQRGRHDCSLNELENYSLKRKILH